jgi:hypothetical protein
MSVWPKTSGRTPSWVEGHNLFTATGEVVVASSELRFRSRTELTDSLVRAGFTIERLCSDWQRGPLS